MIDPTLVPAVEVIAAMGAFCVVVILLNDAPRKRDLDAEGHFPGADRDFSDADRAAIKYGTEMPPPARYAALMPGGKIAFVVGGGGGGGGGMVGVMKEDEELPPIPEADRLRFFVNVKPSRDGFWRVRDRANFREEPHPYKTRSTALRAARRLNAKAEIGR